SSHSPMTCMAWLNPAIHSSDLPLATSTPQSRDQSDFAGRTGPVYMYNVSMIPLLVGQFYAWLNSYGLLVSWVPKWQSLNLGSECEPLVRTDTIHGGPPSGV